MRKIWGTYMGQSHELKYAALNPRQPLSFAEGYLKLKFESYRLLRDLIRESSNFF